MIPAMGGVIAKAAEGIVGSLMGGFDKLFTSKEEKMNAQAKLDEIKSELSKDVTAHLEKMAELQFKETEVYLKDVADARNREIQIATSDKAPMINKIIQPVLAILLLGSCFVMWYTILFKDIPKDKEMIIAGIVGSLTTIAMGVVGYYFGSSKGSEDKSKQLTAIIDGKAKP